MEEKQEDRTITSLKLKTFRTKEILMAYNNLNNEELTKTMNKSLSKADTKLLQELYEELEKQTSSKEIGREILFLFEGLDFETKKQVTERINQIVDTEQEIEEEERA